MQGHSIRNAHPIGKYYSFQLSSENRFYNVILPPVFKSISIENVQLNKPFENACQVNAEPNVTFVLGDGKNKVEVLARMNPFLTSYQWVDIEAALNAKGIAINTAKYFMVHCANLRHHHSMKILIEIEIKYG